jgi:16S rRNA processing protein RimM
LIEPERWIRAGTVGRPHGLDGSFHVARSVPELLGVGMTVVVGGHEREIVRRAGFDARPIVRLDGCEDREAAEALRGTELLVAREQAPELGEDEWWARDLEGCAVRDGSVEVGVVTRLLELPSCEVLEVERPGGGPALLVPLVKDAVRAVDIEGRAIEIDLRFLGLAE